MGDSPPKEEREKRSSESGTMRELLKDETPEDICRDPSTAALNSSPLLIGEAQATRSVGIGSRSAELRIDTVRRGEAEKKIAPGGPGSSTVSLATDRIGRVKWASLTGSTTTEKKPRLWPAAGWLPPCLRRCSSAEKRELTAEKEGKRKSNKEGGGGDSQLCKQLCLSFPKMHQQQLDQRIARAYHSGPNEVGQLLKKGHMGLGLHHGVNEHGFEEVGLEWVLVEQIGDGEFNYWGKIVGRGLTIHEVMDGELGRKMEENNCVTRRNKMELVGAWGPSQEQPFPSILTTVEYLGRYNHHHVVELREWEGMTMPLTWRHTGYARGGSKLDCEEIEDSVGAYILVGSNLSRGIGPWMSSSSQKPTLVCEKMMGVGLAFEDLEEGSRFT
ncbi:unnamed protein product [Linum trigynum]|uniref:Uncharacterized protein n=1 Tax=Linum trigynum TaxID=586398 RepID=A0AAV2DYQ7_9ROSI